MPFILNYYDYKTCRTVILPCTRTNNGKFPSYLVVADSHILLTQLEDGLPGAHIECVPFVAKQQSGVVGDARLGEFHQLQL